MIYSAKTIFGVIYSGVYLSDPITYVNISLLAVVMFGLYALRGRLTAE